ncbi:glucosamine-6-phosphate deaminase [Sinomicrobium weinanense]|uniref:Glucosamine-6-phosphate deaminase n=1 Tax=Sinomicrobium weinanense TaxID=2842200 RepID=A0A926JQ62_9FLAO|nr:glucosamine-6-phosphate deaminase [Sinomicrobium weinanense]MBC9795216.1 glucosamine-6-phosphate deaminase [Sinomicrobium weinanense]MBU3121993.1 glucosamine-6-phosphate deaminase [Sinomicrobium weinanense]
MKTDLIIENIPVSIYENPDAMGSAAADFVERKVKEAIDLKGYANLILATGSSQFTFLEAFKEKEIDWQKITVFHLDEYRGIPEKHPASFRRYLKERILDEVAPKKIYFLNGDAEDVEQEIRRYSNALQKHPIDIACIGIGENGHIAFNDPPVADFNDPKLVKLVTLDEACKNQQINEGWFPTMEDVPKQALTLTITAILNCKAISCVVPDERKARAVHNALYHPISTECPATILRKHPDTRLFLERGSASEI